MSCLLVALKCKLILLSSGDAKLFCDVLRGDSHRHQTSVGPFGLENGFSKQLGFDGVHHVIVGHRFNTATYSDLDLSGSNGVRNSSDSLQSRGTKSVDALDASSVRVASKVASHA